MSPSRRIYVLFAMLTLLASANAALRLRQASRKLSASSSTTTPASTSDAATTTSALDASAEDSESTVEQPASKHKRGILHGAALGGHWPARTYASHYGYSLQLPAAATFLAAAPAVHRPHSFVKYAAGLPGVHYRPLAAAAAATPLGSGAFLPAAGVAPAVASAVAPAVGGIASAVAGPPTYVLRPGNAYVTSYSVNYPHQHLHKPVVSAVKPVHFHAHAHAQPSFVQAFQPAPVSPAVHTLAYQPSVAVQHGFAVQPAPLPAVATEFPAIPQFPVAPAAPALPAVPTFVTQPAQPAIPEVPAIPQIPQIPEIPAIPQIPQIPAIPHFPAVPHFPQFPQFPQIPQFPQVPQVPAVQPVAPPSSQFFPAAVQPPLPQQPPTFVQPEAQFPGSLVPLPAPTPVQPESGTAIASPQIPNTPESEPQLPEAPQPTQPTPQQPWRPVFYQPPAATPNRPSITLLPPYGSQPAEGYLPPVAAQSAQLSQVQAQAQAQGQGIFDQLSDAEIEHIFSQANLAQQQHHHHHHQDNVYQHY